MAKTSSVEKNNRRRKLVKQHAAKRARLKAIIMDKSVSIEERFAAQLKIAEMPGTLPRTAFVTVARLRAVRVHTIANLRCRVWRFARCPTRV